MGQPARGHRTSSVTVSISNLRLAISDYNVTGKAPGLQQVQETATHRWTCERCGITLHRGSKSRHLFSKRHLANVQPLACVRS